MGKGKMNERLEKLSDLVRRGIPISLIEAIEVIEYQSELQKTRKRCFWHRVLSWILS